MLEPELQAPLASMLPKEDLHENSALLGEIAVDEHTTGDETEEGGVEADDLQVLEAKGTPHGPVSPVTAEQHGPISPVTAEQLGLI